MKKRFKSMSRDRFDEAHKYLKRATELSPNDPLILMQYGVLVMEEGRFEEAHEILLLHIHLIRMQQRPFFIWQKFMRILVY